MFAAKSVLIFILLFTLAQTCNAQRFLALDRSGHIRREHFYVSDRIRVKLQGSQSWIGGEIQFISDSMININDSVIPVSKITAIRYNSNHSGAHLLRQASVLFPAAGATLLAISAINSAINHNSPIYSTGLLITAGALIVSGPIAYCFTFHKYKINKRHRLKVMDVTIE